MTEKCISCGVSLDEIIKEYGQSAIDDGYQIENGFLCYPCAEYDLSEAPLTVYHKREEYSKRIGNYISDYWLEGEESPFSMEWVPTDAWRGHYETKASDTITKIFSDSILSYHESEQMLKVLHDIVMKAFDMTDIDYYRVFSRTSNVFCTNLDFYIEKVKEELGKEIIDITKKFVNYDNPVFSTGILFPRENPAEYSLGNVDAVKQTKVDDDVKNLVIEIGQTLLSK